MFRHLLLYILTFLVATAPVFGQINPLDEGCLLDPSQFPPPSPPFAGDAGPGAQLYFPNHGTINVLIVFVQRLDNTFEHCNDIQTDLEVPYVGHCDTGNPAYESWTDETVTEWPAQWSRGPDRQLPTWAQNGYVAAPGANPTTFRDGSLSQYYYLMSNGELEITGYVYPKVYITAHESDWYEDNMAPFLNKLTKESHEIISYVRDNPEGIVIDGRFDNYTNGTNDVGLGFEDDNFDMLILAFRSGGAITSFGSSSSVLGFDGFAPDPLFLGDLQVTDNTRYGGGVRTQGFDVLEMTYKVAHEIGHRQFGYYHTCVFASNCYDYRGESTSVMEASSTTPASMSGPDRVKLGWLHPDTLDVSTFTHLSWTLGDAMTTQEALYIQDGSPAEGDLLIENRGHSNFWDRPADGTNADGDNGDHFYVEEGLYVYKAGIEEGGLGGNYSSMENTGEQYRDSHKTFRTFPTVSNMAYGPGDVYSPFSTYRWKAPSTAPFDRFNFYVSASLDDSFAISNIQQQGSGLSFDLDLPRFSGPRELVASKNRGNPDETRTPVRSRPQA